LARLQNLAGDRPVVMAEVGLDSIRNGEEQQAATLEWQVQSVFRSGACGMFVFLMDRRMVSRWIRHQRLAVRLSRAIVNLSRRFRPSLTPTPKRLSRAEPRREDFRRGLHLQWPANHS